MVQWLLLLVMLGRPRFASRLWRTRRRHAGLAAGVPGRVRLLLVGTGDAGKRFADAVLDDPARVYSVVGMLYPTGREVGRRLGGIPVLGRLDEVTLVLERLRRAGSFTSRIVLTEPLDPEPLRRLVGAAAQLSLTVSRLPSPVELREAVADGRLELRPVALADLLGRPQAALDQAALDRLIRGRRVLITGAGGSIGSELARQIATLGPARLLLLDHAEFNLYEVELELRAAHPDLPLEAHLCDVRDRLRVEQVVGGTRPHLVFHAAALKHVPIVERDPSEGVLTNAVGTRHVADAARACGALAMVLVSTDKAVNPTSVMVRANAVPSSTSSRSTLPRTGPQTGPRRRPGS